MARYRRFIYGLALAAAVTFDGVPSKPEERRPARRRTRDQEARSTPGGVVLPPGVDA